MPAVNLSGSKVGMCTIYNHIRINECIKIKDNSNSACVFLTANDCVFAKHIKQRHMLSATEPKSQKKN